MAACIRLRPCAAPNSRPPLCRSDRRIIPGPTTSPVCGRHSEATEIWSLVGAALEVKTSTMLKKRLVRCVLTRQVPNVRYFPRCPAEEFADEGGEVGQGWRCATMMLSSVCCCGGWRKGGCCRIVLNVLIGLDRASAGPVAGFVHFPVWRRRCSASTKTRQICSHRHAAGHANQKRSSLTLTPAPRTRIRRTTVLKSSFQPP